VTSIAQDGFELHGEATSVRAVIGGVWGTRELLMTLARKDFFVRYRRAIFGTAWAVVIPIVQATVLAIVFTRVARVQTHHVSYPVFVFSGLLPWTYFSTSMAYASTSIVDGQGLATKVYFPRALFPLASVLGSFLSFLPNLAVLLAAALIFRVGLGPQALLLIPATLLMVAITSGFGLVLSAAHVYFRDVRYIVQASLLAWFWGSAIFYPLDAAKGILRSLIEANPVTGMVELFRAAIVGGDTGWHTALWWSLAWVAGLGVAAAELYRRF
jgi:lipopolysaccharide transport system permease protein